MDQLATEGRIAILGAALMNRVPHCALGLMVLTAQQPALAHHSYAMFDRSKSVQVQGTIAKFEWTNPHCFIWVYVPDQPGHYTLYGFEGGGTAELGRMGWTKSSMPIGEKVTVDFFKLKDGRPGGAFVKFTHADGSVSAGDVPPQPGPGNSGPPAGNGSGATP